MKPITSIEATITCLSIPIIQKCEIVVYIDSKHLNFEQKLFHNQKIIHPIDVYNINQHCMNPLHSKTIIDNLKF
jgi:hypothetical protein